MKIIKSGNNFGRSNGDFIIIYFTYIYYSTKYYLNKVQSYWIFISNIIEFSFLIFKTLSRQRYRSYICETDKDNTTRVVDTRQVFLPANECSHKKTRVYLTRRVFVTVTPAVKRTSLDSMKQVLPDQFPNSYKTFIQLHIEWSSGSTSRSAAFCVLSCSSLTC